MEFKKQVYNLKIDDELRDLLPPLTNEEYKTLEENLKRDGCQTPLFTWQGYIADGHNRYGICQKHKIPFAVQELGFTDKSEVMRWMIDGQLGRRNLSPIQRIAIAKKYENKFREEAKVNLSLGGGDQKSPFSERRNPIEKKVDTFKEIAKLANVGTGTLARYDVVMKSDDDELKQKMLSEEIKITAAYTKLKEKEKENIPKNEEKAESIFNNSIQNKHSDETKHIISNKPVTIKQNNTEKINISESHTKKCLKCKTVKPLSEFTSGTDFCDECMKNIYAPIEDNSYIDTTTEVGKIVMDLKTPKVAADYIVVERELLSIKNNITDAIENADERIFERYNLPDKMTVKDKEDAITYMNQLNGLLIKLKNKIEKIEIKGE